MGGEILLKAAVSVPVASEESLPPLRCGAPAVTAAGRRNTPTMSITGKGVLSKDMVMLFLNKKFVYLRLRLGRLLGVFLGFQIGSFMMSSGMGQNTSLEIENTIFEHS